MLGKWDTLFSNCDSVICDSEILRFEILRFWEPSIPCLLPILLSGASTHNSIIIFSIFAYKNINQDKHPMLGKLSFFEFLM